MLSEQVSLRGIHRPLNLRKLHEQFFKKSTTTKQAYERDFKKQLCYSNTDIRLKAYSNTGIP